jgi:hypothetical protein
VRHSRHDLPLARGQSVGFAWLRSMRRNSAASRELREPRAAGACGRFRWAAVRFGVTR